MKNNKFNKVKIWVEFNDDNKILSLQNSLGYSRKIKYDEKGRIINYITNIIGLYTEYYDENSYINIYSERGDLLETMHYNNNGDIIYHNIRGKEKFFEYNENNNLTHEYNDKIDIEYTYDDNNNCIYEKGTIKDSTDHYKIMETENIFNDINKIKETITYLSTTLLDNSDKLHLYFDYDKNGNLIYEKFDDKEEWYTYDDNNKVISYKNSENYTEFREELDDCTIIYYNGGTYMGKIQDIIYPSPETSII